jgi:hypothetical protein
VQLQDGLLIEPSVVGHAFGNKRIATSFYRYAFLLVELVARADVELGGARQSSQRKAAATDDRVINKSSSV